METRPISPRPGLEARGERRRSRDAVTAGATLARGLGAFSLGLGLAELVAPRLLARAVGVSPRPRLFRILGMREIASGIAILAQQASSSKALSRWPLWSRVAGDLIDLSVLGVLALDKRSDRERLGYAATALVGATAIDLYAATGSSRTRPGRIHVVKSVAIRSTPDEVYTFWRELGNLPRFMPHLDYVLETSPNRSHWVAHEITRKIQWDAEVVQDVPGSLIAWRSVEGGDLETEGVVEFQTHPKGGTIVRLAMEIVPPAGALGALVARLAGDDPGAQIKNDLHRLKQLLETGEVATTTGQSAGARGTLAGTIASYFNGGNS